MPKELLVKKSLTFLLLLILCTAGYSQVELSTRLTNAMRNSSPDEYLKVIIYLRDQADIESLDKQLYMEHATLERRAYEVITALKKKAETTQPALISYLAQNYDSRTVFSYKSFWIANMICIEARGAFVQELSNRMDIGQMDLDAVLELDRPAEEPYIESTESAEPGLRIINADKLWALGITGQGRLVMSIDTGVDGNHPALNFKWRGNTAPHNQAWFDPNTNSPLPTDCDGHGTHTMGIMTGWSPAAGDTVGVAINAQWMAAKTICSSPHTSNSLAAFQWAVDPDNNPSTITDMPDAISNSWYDPDVTNECSGIYKTTLDAVEAAGIAVVFSAGNNGPGSYTITKPKNINTNEVNSFCVANINGASYLSGNMNPISNTSSRGPSLCGGTGSLLFKPEVSAPGTSVRSSVPGGGYGLKSGTSMASPHVAGAIALLKEAFPYMTGWEIKLALYNTATDLGADGEDNTYGRGLINLLAAYNQLLPVEMTSFIAEQNNNEIILNWSTSSETNNSGFTIERKGNTSAWTDIGFVPGKGSTTDISNYRFTDKGLQTGKYTYRLKQTDFGGRYEYSNEIEVNITAPGEYMLMQNYPNPFNPSTTIDFSLPEKADVNIAIYTALGELVKIAASGTYDAGYHSVTFDASGLPFGNIHLPVDRRREYVSSKKVDPGKIENRADVRTCGRGRNNKQFSRGDANRPF